MGWSDTMISPTGQVDERNLVIKPNQTVVVHALLSQGEEPISYWSHYIRDAKKSVICPGRDTCPVCKSGQYKAQRKHAMNVYIINTGEVKILEQGNRVYQQIKMIYDQYGTLDDINLSIRRVGEGRDTQYLVIPLPAKEKFKSPVNKFNIYDIKKPNTSDEIEKILHGGGESLKFPPPEDSFIDNPGEVVTPPPPAIYNDKLTFTFGKYNGMTLEDVAQTDFNYIKWCAQNIKDSNIQQEAQRIVNKYSTTTPPPDIEARNNTITSDNEKPLLMSQALNIINTDPRYKNNIKDVIERMKQVTASPTNPNGKMLLQDYTSEELQNLIKILS